MLGRRRSRALFVDTGGSGSASRRRRAQLGVDFWLLLLAGGLEGCFIGQSAAEH